MSERTDQDSQSENFRKDSDNQSINEYVGSNLYYNKFDEDEESDLEQLRESKSILFTRHETR